MDEYRCTFYSDFSVQITNNIRYRPIDVKYWGKYILTDLKKLMDTFKGDIYYKVKFFVTSLFFVQQFKV